MTIKTHCPLLLLLLSHAISPLHAFAPATATAFARRNAIRSPISSVLHSFSPSYANEETIRSTGGDLIRKVAMEAGASEDQITIEWKASKIIVTIDGAVGLSTKYDEDETDLFRKLLPSEDDDEETEDDGEEMEGVEEVRDESEGDGEETEGDVEETEEEEEAPESDITLIARAINKALAEEGEGSLGDFIAKNHEIEVTTPGVRDVLTNDIINVYRGFEVIIETTDPKTGKKKTMECKLVERGEEFTRINVRGRISKLKNDVIDCVRLPNAKYEKGARK